MTFTARSAVDPEKLATFTLQNGHVAVRLGERMMNEIEAAVLKADSDTQEAWRSWLQPLTTGVAQQVIRPFPVSDIDAQVDGETFQATAWMRTGGLRLAPVRITWQQVDNPAAAQAFAAALQERKAEESGKRLPGPFDYWIFWALLAAAVIGIPLWQRRRSRLDA